MEPKKKRSMPLKLTRVLLVAGCTSLMLTLLVSQGLKLTMLSIGGVAFQNGFVKEKKVLDQFWLSG